jgi:REP element-mobilizing transposase RayT
MGIGHHQKSFFTSPWQHRFNHGGTLRRQRAGRGQRPLSTKEPLHVVFKIERSRLKTQSLRSPKTYSLVLSVVRQYAKRFLVKVEQISIQGDHCHLLVRAPRRAKFHHFFRVVAGQIAQRLKLEELLVGQGPGLRQRAVTDTPRSPRKSTGLWKYRPFSRVVRGWRAYKIVRDYIQLNEQEARGKIPSRKSRLRGLSSGEWQLLWS